MAARRRIATIAPEAPSRFFSSGCGLLDCVLGGGWALRRMINVVGDKSTGKTLLAIEGCANFVRAFPQGHVTYDEVESAFDADYAQTLGFPEQNLDLVTELRTVEALWAQLAGLIETQKKLAKDDGEAPPHLVVMDSMDAFSDQAELDREVGEGSYGMAKQKIMSEGFRKYVDDLARNNITLFIISQVRDNINAVGFGAKSVRRAGGKWLDFYASQCLWLYEQKKIKRTIGGLERIVGVDIKARLEKSKVGMPWRDCEFPLVYGYGMEDVKAALAWVEKAAPEELPTLHPDMTKDSWKRHVGKVSRQQVNDWLVPIWDRIDKQFQPQERKYAPATE